MADPDFKPYFTPRDYLFGNNLLAACAQLTMGAVALAFIYAVLRLLAG